MYEKIKIKKKKRKIDQNWLYYCWFLFSILQMNLTTYPFSNASILM